MARKSLIVALTVLLVSGMGVASARDSRVNHQATVTTGTTSTSAQTFHRLGKLSVAVCHTRQVTVDVTVTFRGGPADLKVVQSNGEASGGGPFIAFAPGTVHVKPAAGRDSRSFTFVGPREGSGESLHRFTVKWRSHDGTTVSVSAGAMRVLYERPQHLCA